MVRELLWALLNLAAGVIVAAAAILFADQLGAWRILLWIGVAAFVMAAIGLVIHSIVMRRRGSVAGTDYPNWGIKDLFFYLRPDVLEQKNGVNIWEYVAERVIDKAALDQLQFWGRQFDEPGAARYTLGRRPLQPIEAVYWRNANFSFSFVYADHEAAHTFAGFGNSTPLYTDLQVNKEQAKTIWRVPLELQISSSATPSNPSAAQ
jgi:hypothetical protein